MKTTKSRWRTLLLATLLVTLVGSSIGIGNLVEAHSNWPTFYSAKSAVSIGEQGLETVVVIEIPTFSLVPKFRKHFKDLDLMEEIEKGRFEKLEEEFRQATFEELGEGLTLSIDGEATPGRWRPVDTPINGKANEGFFVYMLEFEPDPPIVLGDRIETEVSNQLYPDENIIFAGYAEARDGWTVLESSAPLPPPGTDLTTGSRAELDLWTTDPALRRFRVVAARNTD